MEIEKRREERKEGEETKRTDASINELGESDGGDGEW